MRPILFSFLLLSLPAMSRADFSYQETTKVTGGAMAGMMKFAGAFSKKANQPMTMAIYLHGNRLARLGATHGEIIDLDKQTITNIDFEKKTYSTMTFAEMRQRMQAAMESAKEKRQQQQAQQPADAPQMKFKISAAPTGLSRSISGYDAKEYLIKVEMDATDQKTGQQQGAANIDAHVWLAGSIAGYQEVRDFYRRMNEQGGFISNEQAAQIRQSFQGMSELNSQLAKMDGTPVMQITDIMMAANQSGDQNQQQARQQQQNADDTSGGLAGMAARGIFGGFGRKKKDNGDASSQSASQAPPGTLMQTTTEYGNFSTAPVDESKFEVPSGFQQITPEMVRPGRP